MAGGTPTLLVLWERGVQVAQAKAAQRLTYP